MTLKIRRPRSGTAAVVCAGIGTAIYLLMINVTLAHIEALSGQIPFDMRPFGYSPLEATHLLDALGDEGRQYYLTRQIPLDLVYPALLGTTLASVTVWLGSGRVNGTLTRIGVAFSICAALFDYMENLGIVVMLRDGPHLSHGIIFVTSLATIAKSCSTVAAATMVLCLGAFRLFNRSALKA